MRVDLSRISPQRLPALVARAPKAELHVHIEGTLEPELAFSLARRNGVILPFESPAALRAARDFTCLQGFLDVYYAAAAVLVTEEDFHDLAWAYLRRVAADNVVRAEIFFDPQAHTARGVPFETVVGGLSRAVDRAAAELGVSAALIMCFLRDLPESAALETLDRAEPFVGRLLGVGLDSAERGNPAGRFAAVFARARRLGLHAVAHAGEEGPPACGRASIPTTRPTSGATSTTCSGNRSPRCRSRWPTPTRSCGIHSNRASPRRPTRPGGSGGSTRHSPPRRMIRRAPTDSAAGCQAASVVAAADRRSSRSQAASTASPSMPAMARVSVFRSAQAGRSAGGGSTQACPGP